jgi:hypothetical protein
LGNVFKTLGRLGLAQVYVLEKERFLSISIKRLNGVDGMSFYKRALRISVCQTNLIPCNHITLEWDEA